MAQAADHEVTLKEAPYDLSIDAPDAAFRVNYTGLGKNSVCSLEIKLSPSSKSNIRRVLNLLKFTELFESGEVSAAVLSPRKAIIGLPLDVYVTSVLVSLRYTGTLRSELQRIGIDPGQLTISGRGCAAE